MYFLIRQLMFHRHTKSWNVCHKRCDINSRHFYHESLDSSHNTQRTSSSVSSLGAGSLEVSLKGQVCSHTRGWRASPQRNEIGIVTTESMVTIFKLFLKATFLPLREQSMTIRSIKDINQLKCQQK